MLGYVTFDRLDISGCQGTLTRTLTYALPSIQQHEYVVGPVAAIAVT